MKIVCALVCARACVHTCMRAHKICGHNYVPHYPLGVPELTNSKVLRTCYLTHQ